MLETAGRPVLIRPDDCPRPLLTFGAGPPCHACVAHVLRLAGMAPGQAAAQWPVPAEAPKRQTAATGLPSNLPDLPPAPPSPLPRTTELVLPGCEPKFRLAGIAAGLWGI